MSDYVKCPVCGLEISLNPHPDQPGRLVAACNHGIPTKAALPVYETDAPTEKVSEPAEEIKPAARKKADK